MGVENAAAIPALDRLLLGPLDDPYPVWRELRATDPVHWIVPFGPWILTRYADVVTALRDPRLGVIGYGAILNAVPAEARGDLATFFGILGMSMVHLNPPDHTRLRRLVSASFTPKVVESMRRLVERDVADLLDSATPAGEMDVLRDFAYPLLARVTAQLVGVPRDDLISFRHYFDAYYRSFGAPLNLREQRTQAEASAIGIMDYFKRLLAERRREPRADLMSAMVEAAQDGPVTEDELAALCIQLLFSGRESTPNFFANALLTLLRHPGELARLRSDSSLMPSAVEELLRYEGVTHTVRRVAREELGIAGRRIGPGQRVQLALAAANRDPERFPDPDRLDLGRRDNHHLGLGHGTHFCLGAAVARLVVQSALQEVLERFPSLRLAGTAEWRSDVPNRFLRSLPISW